MQIWNYAPHMTTAKACVCTYAGILKKNEVKEQTFPMVRELLSAKNKEARNVRSDFAVVYISTKGHRQWPSIAESTVLFIARCVGKAREEFIRQLADLRKQQRLAKEEDARAAREGKTPTAKPSDKMATEEDAEDEEEEEEDKLRYWTAPFKWGKATRRGPPLERLAPCPLSLSCPSLCLVAKLTQRSCGLSTSLWSGPAFWGFLKGGVCGNLRLLWLSLSERHVHCWVYP